MTLADLRRLLDDTLDEATAKRVRLALLAALDVVEAALDIKHGGHIAYMLPSAKGVEEGTFSAVVSNDQIEALYAALKRLEEL